LLLVCGLLALFALVLMAAGLVMGHGDLRDEQLRGTLLRLRALRMSGAFLAGAALATAGVTVQALFRNPLADPAILGAGAGASFGGQLVMISIALTKNNGWLGAAFGWLAPATLLPLGCVAGALCAIALLFLATRRRPDFLVILLMGFVLSSVFVSLGAFVTSLAQESWELGRAVISFTLGSVGGVGRDRLLLAIPLAAAGIVAIWLWGDALDLLLSGEDEASSLGLDVATVRRWSMVWVAFLVAAAVAIGGSVGFVGLVAPHALRPFVGATTRRLVPAAALAGGAFVVVCDLVGRALPARGELPLGVVSGLVGAPIFVVLLLRQSKEGRLG
jgi:iron complex transport system permease protein